MMKPKENKETSAAGYQPTKSDDMMLVCTMCGQIEEDFECCICGGELTLKKKNEAQEKKVEEKKVESSPSSTSTSSTSASYPSSSFSSSSPTSSSSQLPVGFLRHRKEWIKKTAFKNKTTNTSMKQDQDQEEEKEEEKKKSREKEKRSCEGEQAKKRKLRPIVIDGSNIAMLHGQNKKFSVRGEERLSLSLSSISCSAGLKIIIEYFVERGHTEIVTFVPQSKNKGKTGQVRNQSSTTLSNSSKMPGPHP